LLEKWNREEIAKLIASLFCENFVVLKPEKNAYTVTHYVKIGSNESCFTDNFEVTGILFFFRIEIMAPILMCVSVTN
jgi:hypothetical protein